MVNNDLKACIAQVERTSRCLVNSPPAQYGDIRIHKDKIEGRPCYAVQEYKQGKAFDCWLDVTSEPFGTLEQAMAYLEHLSDSSSNQ
tara:strand:- start:4135 stop:4395 length:261 start_codon:yes stop_codon:yes gene_type:complete